MLFELEHHEKFNILKIAEKKITAEYSAQLKVEFMQLAQENKSLICDLGQVDYSDSSGLSAFLIADRLFKEKNFVFIDMNVLTNEVMLTLNNAIKKWF